MSKFIYRITSITILTLPIMVGLQSGLKFNIALSDFFIPILVLAIFYNSSKIQNKSIHRFNREYTELRTIYIIGIIGVLLINLFKLNLIHETTQTIRGFIDTFKILINIVYFIVFNHLFRNYGAKFEDVFIKTWYYTSIMVSIMAILGVILYYLGIQNIWTMDFRAIGPFNDPNLLAIYLLISISISSIYNIKRTNKFIHVSILINIIAIILTASRSAIITVLGAIIITGVISFINHDYSNIKKALIDIITIIIIIIIAGYIIIIITEINLFESALGRLDNITETISTDSRISKWMAAIKIWLNYPLFGAGIGMYIDTSLDMGLTTVRVLAHNTYLSFLSELGIIGFFAFMWFPANIFIQLIKLYNINRLKTIYILFAMSCLFITLLSLNLQNFRCMWIFYSFAFNYILNIKRDSSIKK